MRETVNRMRCPITISQRYNKRQLPQQSLESKRAVMQSWNLISSLLSVTTATIFDASNLKFHIPYQAVFFFECNIFLEPTEINLKRIAMKKN
ncbi:hypothetical protein T12_15262 [Trichinella patagoniensis]|uniref:Uncharacterized protein n=1 Tax=Trichinella patagoniensis TaxID=990121 RepID=A0A0V0ZDN0_9BILA|nr:hypothetical protein T12_15262 [Trichinella patagoniensis]